MFFKKDETLAQFADRFLRRVALAVLLMAISYTAAATLHFVEGNLNEALTIVRKVFGIGAALIVLPQFINFIRLRMRVKDCGEEPEGFIAEIYGQSAVSAFAVAFVTMVFLEPFAGKAFSDLPPDFFIQAMLALMMATLGINFFIRSRAGDDELDDEFDDDFTDAEQK